MSLQNSIQRQGCRGQGGCFFNFLKVVGFSEILIFFWKFFWSFTVVKDKGFIFYEKFFEPAPPYLTGVTTSLFEGCIFLKKFYYAILMDWTPVLKNSGCTPVCEQGSSSHLNVSLGFCSSKKVEITTIDCKFLLVYMIYLSLLL